MKIPVTTNASNYYQNRYPLPVSAAAVKVKRFASKSNKKIDTVEISAEAYSLYQDNLIQKA